MIPTCCWHCGERLSLADTERWWQRLTTGRINHGPYCAVHEATATERRVRG